MVTSGNCAIHDIKLYFSHFLAHSKAKHINAASQPSNALYRIRQDSYAWGRYNRLFIKKTASNLFNVV